MGFQLTYNSVFKTVDSNWGRNVQSLSPVRFVKIKQVSFLLRLEIGQLWRKILIFSFFAYQNPISRMLENNSKYIFILFKIQNTDLDFYPSLLLF